MTAKASVAKQRNDVAHGVFGVTPADSEGLAWLSTNDRMRIIIETDRFFFGPPMSPKPSEARELASFYMIDDLERVFDDIVSVHRLIHAFGSYVGCRPIEGTDPHPLAELNEMTYVATYALNLSIRDFYLR